MGFLRRPASATGSLARIDLGVHIMMMYKQVLGYLKELLVITPTITSVVDKE